ncbi:MAG: DUF6452 family protein [Paludibacteraceae bacterium]|nr:DUF6452 family protein [Paludibacteraceae bacterium]
MKHALCYSILLLVATLYSCRPDAVCREALTVGLVGELRETYPDNNNQPQLRTAWDSITVQGIGSDSLLYDNRKNIGKIVLPMRHDIDSTGFVLTYRGCTDTLYTWHTSERNFVSVECGCVYNHDVLHLSYTRHWIDSIAVIDNQMTRQGETNIYYLRTERN